jgi:hypothetical protein
MLEEALETGEFVTGKIINRVKGGFSVEVEVVKAFLPGSLVDVRPVKEPGRNALTTSTSTENPPLTLLIILPVTNSPVSNASSSIFQVEIFLAFSLEILVSP